MFQQNNVVLIGNSVVEQSKSIAHLNKRVINIDSFNDTDLIGENYKNSNLFGFVNNEVIAVLENLKLNKEDTLIIVSSDYDKENNYYELLKKYGYIVGNNYKNISKLKNTDDLFSKLELNNIKYPDKIININNNHGSLVLKNPYISGGLGVKKVKTEDIRIPEKNEFYQKYINGPTYSVLFISNAYKEFSIIGINQIFNKKTSLSDFCFSGATSNVKLDKNIIENLKNIINFCVSEYNLIGFNGIDFILSDEIYFLELNPRITQTCFMYDKNFDKGYVHACA
jgi:predicted ATP-grasp superfamily ATP-dependent carboligase